MTKNNNSRTSREALESRHDLMIADGNVPAQIDMEADADAEFLDGVLSQLRSVRVPGREKLTLDEAIEAAQLQFAAFQNWLKSGKPIGAIKGWIDGKEEFICQDLREITFGVPPSDDAVLQITTQVDGEEIVLYNLRLQDVPDHPLTHTERWPNGQHMSFTIVRQRSQAASQGSTSVSSVAQFCVNITVNAEPSDERFRAKKFALETAEPVDSLEDDTPPAKDNGNYKAWILSGIDWVQTRLSIPRVRFAAVLGVVLVPIGVALLIQNVQWSISAQPPGTEQMVKAPVAKDPANEQAQKQTEKIPDVPAAANPQSLGVLAIVVVQNRANPERVNSPNPSIGWRLAAALLPTPTVPAEPEVTANGRDESQPNQGLERSPRVSDFFGGYKTAEINRFANLGVLQQVSVRLHDTAAPQGAEAELLLSSFTHAFEASSRFKVLGASDNSRADVVIGLRYEPNEPDSGVVVVEIRDSFGKFIWQDFAACEKSAQSDHGAMFTVAAESLVNSLTKVIDVSRQFQMIGRR